METDVALFEVQVSVALPFGAMVVGLAVSVAVVAVAETVTVTEAVVLPPAPVAVIV
jgi:hypothetical protein